MDDDITPAAIAWLRAALRDDTDALAALADTVDHLDLLEHVTGGFLGALHYLGVDDIQFDQALARLQQQMLVEEAEA